MSDDLIAVLSDLKKKEALEIVEDRLNARQDPQAILRDAARALEIVGDRFEKGTYYIPDLVYSGKILRDITEIVKPKIQSEAVEEKLGKVIIGTVAGDIHDIGKDIVSFMLDISGFEVIDLGVDVPVEVFVEKIRDSGATVVGLSGFLTLAFDAMKNTVDAIKSAGLRDRIKIMIGGGVIDEDIVLYTGADEYGSDAMKAVSLAKKWMETP